MKSKDIDAAADAVGEEQLRSRIEAELADGIGAPEPFVFYDSEGRAYLLRSKRGVWLSLSESQLKRHLRQKGISSKIPEGESLSPMDCVILEAQNYWDVRFAGRLCGKREGFYDEHGSRFLVTEAPKLHEPLHGEWPTIERVICGLLRDNEPDTGQVQFDVFCGWLKFAVQALRESRIHPAQALAIAGPAGCGKSLLQSFLTECFGGRVAKPARYMAGETPFNGELFEAEHLALEDEYMSPKAANRIRLGHRIKEICVSSRVQSCHRKGRQAVTLPAWWRLSITLNDNAESMMVLPPLDDGLGDKIILLRASPFQYPVPMDSAGAQAELWRRISEEIPAFMHFLLSEFTVPENLRELNRYGVKSWHHPALRHAVESISPEAELLALIDSVLWDGEGTRWRGTGQRLRTLLQSDGRTASDARRLLEWPNATGTYLRRLASKEPSRVRISRTAESRDYEIASPAHSFAED